MLANASLAVPPKPAISDGRCRAAIDKIFPEQYRAEAYIALHHENASEKPGRVGGRNYDGTYDRGCLQVNPRWYGRPGTEWQMAKGKRASWDSPIVGIEGSITERDHFNRIYDPEFNIRVSYDIFKNSNNTWNPWYGPCTKGKEKLPLKRCGR